MTSLMSAPASASARAMFSMHFAACAAKSPTPAVEPSSFKGQEPARKINLASAGAVAAYAYSATSEREDERISVTALDKMRPPNHESFSHPSTRVAGRRAPSLALLVRAAAVRQDGGSPRWDGVARVSVEHGEFQIENLPDGCQKRSSTVDDRGALVKHHARGVARGIPDGCMPTARRIRLLLTQPHLFRRVPAIKTALAAGPAAAFGTRTPHWFGATGADSIEYLSVVGRQVQRPHVHAYAGAMSDGRASQEGVDELGGRCYRNPRSSPPKIIAVKVLRLNRSRRLLVVVT
ncbi:hypothetical protein M2317_001991 [Microbacterium sp. ZKA21]